MNTNSVYHDAVKLMVEARTIGGQDLVAVLVVTSMDLSALPKWLREQLDHEIHCYRGFMQSSSRRPTE